MTSLYSAALGRTFIVSLSLGGPRTFALRLRSDTTGLFSVGLHEGDLCTMEGLLLTHYQHRVPHSQAREAKVNLAGQ